MKAKLSFIFCMVVLALSVWTGLARPDELKVSEQLAKLPALKQGLAFSLLDNEVSYLTTLELVKWNAVCLEVGYSSKDKAVGVISYELLKLKNLGVTVPVLDLIEANLGLYAGYGRIALGPGNAKDNNEFDWGTSLTLIKVKF